MVETWKTERLLFTSFLKSSLREGDPTAATILSEPGPFDLEPGQTLVLAAEAGGDQTVTFAGTVATRLGAAQNFAGIIGGETLELTIGDQAFSIVFDAARRLAPVRLLTATSATQAAQAAALPGNLPWI